MRVPFLGLLTAGLVAGQIVAAPLAMAQCVRPTEASTLDIMGLKTSLMVTALTCSAEDRYNAFVTKFKPELASQEKALTAYFSRVHGRVARKQQDDYVTQLANSRSQENNRQGSLYCSRNMPVFDEVMTLRNNAELADYAAGRSVEQPMAATACGATPTAPAVTRASTHTPARHTTKHRG